MFFTLLKNLLRSFALFLVVTFATFCLMYGNARGIAFSTLGLRASEEDIQAQIVRLGLDRPLIDQYWSWLSGSFTGDLGRSFYTSESVASALSNRVPVTLTIVLLTIALTAVVAVLLGVTAAVRGGWADRVVQVLSIIGTAVPAFIVAIALVFLFAINWRVFPATGFVQFDQSPSDWARSLVLPVVALLIGSVANAAQQFRTAMLDTLGRDFIRTLRARGVSERQLVFRNALRNAAAPGLTVLNLQLFAVLGGAVFIEQVFALAGMGQLANAAAQIQDVPMVMGTVLVTVLIVLSVNFVADILITVLNPKARAR